MSRSTRGIALAGVALLFAGCAGLGARSGVTPMARTFEAASGPAGPAGYIKHVVIIFQENRTPDNLFQGLPGADIASSGLDSKGHVVQLQPIPLRVSYDIAHTHAAFLEMYDGGRMDGANLEPVRCRTACTYQNPQYGYVPKKEVKPYLDLAEQYTFADRMFQTNQGPSYPAHQYIIAGTSEPFDNSNLLAAENPDLWGAGREDAGCAAPQETLVRMIDPQGHENTKMYPCFEHQTLLDLLDAHGVTWHYYGYDDNGIWTAPNSIKHIRNGPDWQYVTVYPAKVLSDVAHGRLAQVAWVMPTPAESDHSGANRGKGPAWVASVVNAIGSSKYWKNTAIFILWDDWGGWYDHVPPPTIYNSYELGFRVPLIVVSPYAKRAHVSHDVYEFGSILKFTEETFGLGTLGYTDERAQDLSDCFNFTQQPSEFHPIAAPYGPAYFLANEYEHENLPEDY